MSNIFFAKDQASDYDDDEVVELQEKEVSKSGRRDYVAEDTATGEIFEDIVTANREAQGEVKIHTFPSVHPWDE